MNTRPLVFAVECLAALALASVGGYIADRMNHKRNRDSQSFERGAAALERMAYAQEHHGLPRPSMLPAADRTIRIITVPAPDPDPCPSSMSFSSCAEKSARAADNREFERSLSESLKETEKRFNLITHQFPTLGGTARE